MRQPPVRIRQQAESCPLARWCPAAFVVFAVWGMTACAAIPSKFVRQAEPRVTLAEITHHPEVHRGKVVILGGVLVAQHEEAGRLWLLVRNRPLDEDYVPHLPASIDPAEAGQYWVMVGSAGLPKASQRWARLTVVGRVADQQPVQHEQATGKEPVLAAMYLRGWGDSPSHEAAWEESQDANYIMTTPVRTE